MNDDEPRITAEHVRRAEQIVKRSYAQPYIARSVARMRAVFMASMLWAIFIGIVLGRYALHYFPWGNLVVAIVFTVLAVVQYRRNRG
jgi:F0F1-type ATP synthase assembly protein I